MLPQPDPLAAGARVYLALATGEGEDCRGLRTHRRSQRCPRLRGMAHRPFSTQSGPVLSKAGCLDGASAIWSLWHAYLEEPSGKRLCQFLHAHDISITELHLSGHTSVADLNRLVSALEPDRLVLIHSFGSARLPDLFDNVNPTKDGDDGTSEDDSVRFDPGGTSSRHLRMSHDCAQGV
jgi:hypothetical protein